MAVAKVDVVMGEGRITCEARGGAEDTAILLVVVGVEWRWEVRVGRGRGQGRGHREHTGGAFNRPLAQRNLPLRATQS